MKTKISLLLGLSLLVIILASCGGGRKISCPAYSSTNMENSDLASK